MEFLDKIPVKMFVIGDLVRVFKKIFDLVAKALGVAIFEQAMV